MKNITLFGGNSNSLQNVPIKTKKNLFTVAKKKSQNLYIIMRTSVELFKSVILRTKSFKVFILLILVISCLIIQLNNNNENIIDNKISEDENSLFDDHDDYEKPGLEIDLNNPYAGITKDESSSNDAKVSQIFQK